MMASDDRPQGQTVAKFVQICASQNDLFALDEGGNVHQYDFNAKTWEKLVASRSHEGLERGDRGKRRRARGDFEGSRA